MTASLPSMTGRRGCNLKNLQWLATVLETCNYSVPRPRPLINSWKPTSTPVHKAFPLLHSRAQHVGQARLSQHRSFSSTRRPGQAATERSTESLSRSSKGSKSHVNKKKVKQVQDSTEIVEKWEPRKKPDWLVYKEALKAKFPDGWNPRKKISPDAQEGIRALHAQYPEECTKEALADQFKISPEAVRRILKAKPKRTEALEVQARERWVKRHDQIWDNKVQMGLRPPRRKDRSEDDDSYAFPSFERSA